jgi:hypothetical protein
VTLIRTTLLLFFLAFVIFNTTFLGYVTNFDRLTPAFAASSQVNGTSNLTDQIVQLKNLASNQSSDMKDIKKLMSQEVELLKSMGQGFSKTTTQASFTALGVFFLGMTLVIYGLRLTLKATDRRTSRYFKAMMLGLITPVIALLVIYHFGVPIYKSDDSFFLMSVLLMIPVAMIIFLLIAEGRLIPISHQKDQQERKP